MAIWHVCVVMVVAFLSLAESGEKTKPCKRCNWELTVTTADDYEAGTDKPVYIRLFQTDITNVLDVQVRPTKWIELVSSKNDFGRGSTNVYIFDVYGISSYLVKYYQIANPDNVCISRTDMWKPKTTILRNIEDRQQFNEKCEYESIWVYGGDGICCGDTRDVTKKGDAKDRVCRFNRASVLESIEGKGAIREECEVMELASEGSVEWTCALEWCKIKSELGI